MEQCFLVTYGRPIGGEVMQALCETLELAQVYRDYVTYRGFILTRIDTIYMEYDVARTTV